MKWFLSTIDPQAGDLARANGLGVEIAEFCTAWNMDRGFLESDALVTRQIAGISRRVLHGPFNELFPCAIDPLARELAEKRYRQAIALAERYGAKKVVFHGGYHPKMYYPVWYVAESVKFWRGFLQYVPERITLCLENVLEETPDMLSEIAAQVDDPRLRLCLDVGHVNAYSQIPALTWVREFAPYLSHLHIHNNDGTADTHSGPEAGTLPMDALLTQIGSLPGDITMTLELPQAEEGVRWLKEKGVLQHVYERAD